MTGEIFLGIHDKGYSGKPFMVVPASYTSYAVLFLRMTSTLPQCGQAALFRYLALSKYAIQFS